MFSRLGMTHDQYMRRTRELIYDYKHGEGIDYEEATCLLKYIDVVLNKCRPYRPDEWREVREYIEQISQSDKRLKDTKKIYYLRKEVIHKFYMCEIKNAVFIALFWFLYISFPNFNIFKYTSISLICVGMLMVYCYPWAKQSKRPKKTQKERQSEAGLLVPYNNQAELLVPSNNQAELLVPLNHNDGD